MSCNDGYGGSWFYKKDHDGLTEIPNDIPDNVTVVYLYDNDISSVRRDVFAHVTEMYELVLTQNQISEI